MKTNEISLSLGARWRVALACFGRVLASGRFAAQIQHLLSTGDAVAPAAPPPAATPLAPLPGTVPAAIPPERLHASGLALLATLQREGRLIDFLQEDMRAFSDAEIGAAARIVHAGCRKALQQGLVLEPVLQEAEGAPLCVPAGFDAQRIRLTGNLSGQPPFRGALKHHGWQVSSIRLPVPSEKLDQRILAPAEVEL
jgi:hypothetical protein